MTGELPSGERPMSIDLRDARERAVPWHPNQLVSFYQHSHPVFHYRDEVLKLVADAHRLFVLGFPTASIVMSGEGLLRAIYDRIVALVIQRRSVRYTVNRREVLLRASDIGEKPYDWNDYLSFNEAVHVLKRSRVYTEPLTRKMFVVKELRNRSVHDQLPVLQAYDPDDPRPQESFIKMLTGQVEVPEAYRFQPSKNRPDWELFSCHEHGIDTLRGLSREDRYAAIQFVLTVETIAGMLSYP